MVQRMGKSSRGETPEKSRGQRDGCQPTGQSQYERGCSSLENQISRLQTLIQRMPAASINGQTRIGPCILVLVLRA